MKNIMSFIIDECQSAFISGRGLLDNVVMANEILEDIKRNGKSGVCFKVDFEKAYDFHDKVVYRVFCSICYTG